MAQAQALMLTVMRRDHRQLSTEVSPNSTYVVCRGEKLIKLIKLFNLVNPKKNYQRWPANPNNFIRVIEFSKKIEAMFLFQRRLATPYSLFSKEFSKK